MTQMGSVLSDEPKFFFFPETNQIT